MRTRSLIIIFGIILLAIILTLFFIQIYIDASQQEFSEKWRTARALIMSTQGLHELSSADRDEFIIRYTDVVHDGKFHSQVYITDLQDKYAAGQPITFTVATWGYGHPCQSPDFVYYHETNGTKTTVFEDRFIIWCQALHEEDYVHYYNELDSSRTEQASDHNVYPVFDLPGKYGIIIDGKVDSTFFIE